MMRGVWQSTIAVSTVVAITFCVLFGVFKYIEPAAFTTVDDPYFHARYALDLARGATTHLPYDSTLTWYGDGHSLYAGYHLMLAGIASWFATSTNPEAVILPIKLFHAMLVGIFFGVFVAVTKRLLLHMDLSPYEATVGSILAALFLYSATTYFTFRLLLERPQILAMILFLILLDSVFSRTWIRLEIVSFVLPLVYSLSLIAFVPVISYALVMLWKHGFRAWYAWLTPLLCAFGGFTLGVMCTPDPVHYLVNALGIHLVVLWHTLWTALPRVIELTPPGFGIPDLLWILPLSAALIDASVSYMRGRQPFGFQNGVVLLLSTAVFCLVMARIQRASEYAMPLAAMFLALYGARLLQSMRGSKDAPTLYASRIASLMHPSKAQRMIGGALVAIIAFVYPFHTTYLLYAASARTHPEIALAQEMARTLAKPEYAGTRMFLPMMGTYPLLSFYIPHLYYSQGIDPMFTYAADPARFWVGYHAYHSPNRICTKAVCSDGTISLYDAIALSYGADFVGTIQNTDGSGEELQAFVEALDADQRFTPIMDTTLDEYRAVIYAITK